MHSPKIMTVTDKLLQPRILIPWVVIIALVRFVNLGFLDLQGWDEGLYALRSKSIVQFGDWLDQTQYVPGGLVTSCYPPLTFWTTAVFYKLLGPSELTSRLTSALFGSATVLLIVLLVRRVASYRAALLAGILLGTNTFYTFFTRQGQLDAAYVFFVLLSAVGWLIWNDEKEGTQRLWGFFYIAAGTWGAFMSKILVGFYVPLILLLAQAIVMRRGWNWRIMIQLCSPIGAGILLALPWHVFMFLKHGSAFLDAFLGLHLVQRLLAPIEGHNPSLGLFFYVNQLVVQFPESALGIGLCVLLFRKKVREALLAPRVVPLAVAWSMIVVFVITTMATKIPQYILPLSVPVALLGGVALGLMAEGRLQRGQSAALMVLFTVFTTWSALWPVRAYIKNNVLGLGGMNPYTELSLVMVLIAVVSLWCGISLRFSRSPVMLERVTLLFVFVLIFLLTLRVILEITVNDRTQYDIGTRTVADVIRERGAVRVAYVGKDLNPALDLYLKGWDSWKGDIRVDYQLPEPTALAPATTTISPPRAGEVTMLVEEKRMADLDQFVNLKELKAHSSIIFSNRAYEVRLLEISQ